jgi:hypothetical protein
MSTESIIFRLRRANPVPQMPARDETDLFARIILQPADPRVAQGPGGRRLRHHRRLAVLAFAAALGALLASTAFAISHWIGGSVVRPPVTKQEYLSAQAQLTLPPGAHWPNFVMPAPNTVTTRGGGGGRAVLTAQNAWECYWVEAIRTGDTGAGRRAQQELNALLSRNVFLAPVGAPEDWTPSPLPKVPFAVFASDGGLEWKQSSYAMAAAGHPHNLIQSCRANAPG